ncbi:MAG: amidohydrolase family protein [Gammaproteobacteria bacterium]|nr:amidohydrolase family protein [Gammaproteobacteria bacterium]MBL6999260.1 amidohydrolase family protein [Gammaproteobacteria bacterium]
MEKIFTILILLVFSGPVLCASTPFADIHLHFNWDQKEIISAQEVVKRLQAHNVVLATVSSTPSELALELSEAGGPWIQPFFSPYLTPAHRDRWFLDETVLVEADKGLASGRYKGIGELHIWSGIGPRRDNKILLGLLALADKYQVPFLIHTEASSHLFFTPLCQNYPSVKFIWAHAGGRLKPASIDQLMQQCPNVWVEVSVRDPWRYHTLVDDQNQLLPGWRELFIKYQDRFMTGSDPVWNVTHGQRWAQADNGWDHYDQLMEFHRHWLKQLPAEVETKIRLTNATELLTGKVSGAKFSVEGD